MTWSSKMHFSATCEQSPIQHYVIRMNTTWTSYIIKHIWKMCLSFRESGLFCQSVDELALERRWDKAISINSILKKTFVNPALMIDSALLTHLKTQRSGVLLSWLLDIHMFWTKTREKSGEMFDKIEKPRFINVVSSATNAASDTCLRLATSHSLQSRMCTQCWNLQAK